ncbi:MAG: integrase arm-type DNA-binding domain-containing protein [Azonexus sp.]|nr:integrase arm-type DNA-binding domain-containing protein [Azonexus sp.]MBP6203442.1 integrase arm-type DNA-binding domain-containing protein [Azonexus sp.]
MAKAKTFNPDDYIKPGVHSTGEPNLYLLISTVGNNARSWTFRYYRDGKTNVLGLGPLHTVSFNEAKVKALELRRWLLEGKDPKIELGKRKLAAVAKLTFDQCVTQYIAAKTPEWSNPKHIKQWSATLATYASPIIGTMPVDQVETSHLLKILNPIWATKTETATRVRQRIEAVLAYAKSLKLRDGDNPAAWEDHLKNLLALPSTLKKVKHHPSLPWQQMPAFIAALRQREGQAAKAIELLILCANRSIEVRGAEWKELTLRQKLGPSRANA